MAPTLPTSLPESFSAGSTVLYRKSYADYPVSEGWSLTVHLRGWKTLNATAVVDGDAFVVTLPTSGTATLDAGTYRWVERMTGSGVYAGQIYDADSGLVIVTPNLAAAADGDVLTWAEKTLSIVESAIDGRLPSGLESYQIAGRAVSKIPFMELRALRRELLAEISRAKNPTTFGTPVLFGYTPTGFDQ